MNNQRDVFICHANVDKARFVQPLLQALDSYGITYWIDEAEIDWGESIVQKVNEGIGTSRFVLVFLTRDFIARNWPQKELWSALSLEVSRGETVVLPVLAAEPETVFVKYPLLRDKRYLDWNAGPDQIAEHLSQLLGKEFKESWVLFHPAEYAGEVWIKLIARSENSALPHTCRLRWGPWELWKRLSFGSERSLYLVHAKSKDQDGIAKPLMVSVSLACHVLFGQGNPPGQHLTTIDVNHGWRRVE